jgi:UDP-N-acetylmuramoyl-tripeptide--D-alanyl-D-alanine ligase
MLELGDSSVELHQAVVSKAAQLGLEGLVAVATGEEATAMQRAAEPFNRFALVDTPELAAEALNHWLEPGDTLLLKASRGVALERLIPLLKQP